MQTIISGQMKSEPKCSTDKLGNDLNFYRNEYYKRGELIEKLKAEKSNALRAVKKLIKQIQENDFKIVNK